ncbi:MAG: hypothetical protein IIA88_09895 [Bacteroidetes bacterium]|nr:hypothetical protein [Bacteroidota bacterium]
MLNIFCKLFIQWIMLIVVYFFLSSTFLPYAVAQQVTFPNPKVIKAGKPKVVKVGNPIVMPAGILYNFTNYNIEEGLLQSQVRSIYEDSKGYLWFSTYGGVCKYDGETFTYFSTKEGLSNNTVWSILEDKSGNLWFGTDGGGVNKYDGETFTHFTTKEGLSDNKVMGLLEDNKGNIWIGTYGGGISILSKKYKVKSKKSEDGNGNTSPNKSGSTLRSDGREISNNERLLSNYEWKYITTNDGLADDGVVSLVFDAEGYVWAGMNKGISRINTETFEVRSYTKLEGFTGIECNQNASYLDSKGNLWFGTALQLTKYNPKADWVNKLEPQTHIKGVRLFFEEVEWNEALRITNDELRIDTNDTNRDAGKLAGVKYTGVTKWYPLPENLVLPYDKNHLTFEYVGISLKIPEKVRYQFMLEGFEEDWSPVTKKREATYTNLSPGDYVFKVKACNDEGVWNKVPAAFPFRIELPYWERWWFYVGQVLFFGLLIGGTLLVSRVGKSENIITAVVIICLFVIFEFIQNLCEPFYEKYVGSAPIIKTLLNLILFGILFPVQIFLRKYLIGRKKKKLGKKLEELT